MTRLILAVALGGALGSVLRLLTGQWVVGLFPRNFYLGTFTVNLVGCLLMGALAAVFLLRSDLPIELRSGLTVGVLGGFTTFSSFSLELFKLIESGRVSEALAYLLCSLVGGVLAVWAGFALVRLWQ